MDETIMYPRKCRRNLHILKNEIGICVETAYAMMLMTAALMDLNPEDEEVLHIIMKDCGMEE